jgi:hypothetical protein
MTSDDGRRVESVVRDDERTVRHECGGYGREHEASRRHFDTAFESMNHEIRLVAEAVARFDEKLDRTAERLEQKIETSATETRAMIQP